MNAAKTTTERECYSSSLPTSSSSPRHHHPPSPPTASSSPAPDPQSTSSPPASTASASYFVTLTSGRHLVSKETEDSTKIFGVNYCHGDRFDSSLSINASSPYTPVTSVLGFRDMRRHCPPTSHPSQVSKNEYLLIFRENGDDQEIDDDGREEDFPANLELKEKKKTYLRCCPPGSGSSTENLSVLYDE